MQKIRIKIRVLCVLRKVNKNISLFTLSRLSKQTALFLTINLTYSLPLVKVLRLESNDDHTRKSTNRVASSYHPTQNRKRMTTS